MPTYTWHSAAFMSAKKWATCLKIICRATETARYREIMDDETPYQPSFMIPARVFRKSLI